MLACRDWDLVPLLVDSYVRYPLHAKNPEQNYPYFYNFSQQKVSLIHVVICKFTYEVVLYCTLNYVHDRLVKVGESNMGIFERK